MKSKQRYLWLISLMVLGLWFIGGCVSVADYQRMENKYRADLQALKNHNEQLARAKNKSETDNARLGTELEVTQADNQRLKTQIRSKEDAMIKLQEDILVRLSSIEGVNIVGLNAEIQGEVLFDPGKAELKEKGREVLAKVAEVFKKFPEYIIRIEGHTDNDPISQSKDLWTTGSNFELAAYRALKVILYLEEQGIDPARMYLCSFGEHQPKTSNDSPKNKAMNRRVVIGFQKMIKPSEETEKEKPKESEESGEMRK